MIQVFHDHADHRDKFAMIAIHDSSAKSLEEMDRQLGRAKDEYWKGEDLPFPVLLDSEGKTVETFGVDRYPTKILIDPEGKVVGEATLDSLEKELPELDAAVLWARHLDLQKNAYWAWAREDSLRTILESVEFHTDLKIELDVEAAKELGVDLESGPPALVDGYGITLRSLEQLMFHSIGMSLEPSEDGKSLLLTKHTRPAEPPSYFQSFRKKELEKRIATQSKISSASEKTQASGNEEHVGQPKAQKPAAEDTPIKIPSLELEKVRLGEAVTRITAHFLIPTGIDKEALKRADRLVSGRIRNEALKETLNQMLEPLGLHVIVKFEMVLITPIK